MPVRNAEARWEGKIQEGKGTMRLGSGAFEGRYSFKSRFEDGPGTNPEELIGAAHAGCFSMALSLLLGDAGYNPDFIETKARVHIEKVENGFKITRIDLETRAQVPRIGEDEFKQKAEDAKKGCPVSQALTGVNINLKAALKK